MANTNAPSGFKPIKHLTGGAIRLSEYSIASGYGTAIYSGDRVEMTGTGTNVAKSAAGNTDDIGTFAGVMYVDSVGNQVFSKHWPASTTATDIRALVYDDPNIVFEVQCDTLAEADVGQLVDLNVGTGSATTGLSGAYADVGAGTATTGKTFKILRLVPRANNAYGAYAKAEVIAVEHAHSGVVSGVGGI